MIAYDPVDTRPYIPPRDLTAADVEVGIWPLVERVNQTGWVWTVESCEGHPERAGDWPAMLRFAFRARDSRRVLDALIATVATPDMELRLRYLDPPVDPCARGWRELRVASPAGVGPLECLVGHLDAPAAASTLER